MKLKVKVAAFMVAGIDRKNAFIADVVKLLADHMDDDGLAVPQEVRFLAASKPAREASTSI